LGASAISWSVRSFLGERKEMNDEFEKRITKEGFTSAGAEWSPKNAILFEKLFAIIDEARKEFLDIVETKLSLKINGKVDWKKAAKLMELRNIIRLKWFEKWFGD